MKYGTNSKELLSMMMYTSYTFCLNMNLMKQKIVSDCVNNSGKWPYISEASSSNSSVLNTSAKLDSDDLCSHRSWIGLEP